MKTISILIFTSIFDKKVKYNTNLPGTFNKSITVTSNAENSNVMLRVKGNVKPKAE